ncbi:MAG: ABC transporter ATP-binding protein [Candidatus Nanopelagicales bacterium]|nr:ABC transporter ATP-binding protein [Candidatus Nanopelagicales bacterium]
MIPLLRAFLGRHRRTLIAIVTLLLIQAVANLYLPNLNADIINNGVLKGDAGYILHVGAIMLAVTLVLGVVSVIAIYFSARTAMAFGRDVRRALFVKVGTFSLNELNEFGAPTLITRNTNDVQQVQMLVLSGLTMMISAPLTAIGGVFMAMRENFRLSALLIVIIPLMALLIGFMLSKAVPLFRSMQVKIDQVNSVLRENLVGIRVIRAFVRTRHEEERFAAANDDLTDTALRVTRLFAFMLPSMLLIFNLSSVAIIWFGGHLVDSGEMPIGNLTAFLAYVMQILFSVMMAVVVLVMLPRASASADRIQAILRTSPTIRDPANPRMGLKLTGHVEFRDVEFRYPSAEDPVLRGVSLTLRPGQTTAIVGGTGSGKSTLTNLIPRLNDVSSGAVLIDGVDVREWPMHALRAGIGLVPQKAFLFSGTVASNVRFGRPEASDDEVWQALRTAQASGFVSEMAEGLGSPIDQGGANLSGGQRQRLAIARAIVRRPRIYIFDDSFSALDYATDGRLRAALARQTADASVLVVAQRVSTIMGADQIVVLDQGVVVGVGTHSQLMESCETYREIVFSQLSEAEVA